MLPTLSVPSVPVMFSEIAPFIDKITCGRLHMLDAEANNYLAAMVKQMIEERRKQDNVSRYPVCCSVVFIISNIFENCSQQQSDQQTTFLLFRKMTLICWVVCCLSVKRKKVII